jgi:class 3 adenylate cyclase
VQLASTSTRSLGLVATQTLTFLFAGIEGSTKIAQRLGDAYVGVPAGLEVRRAGRIAAVAHGG